MCGAGNGLIFPVGHSTSVRLSVALSFLLYLLLCGGINMDTSTMVTLIDLCLTGLANRADTLTPAEQEFRKELYQAYVSGRIAETEA